MSDEAAQIRATLAAVGFGTVPYIERSITTACFILLVAWLVVRWIVHICETPWTKKIDRTVESPEAVVQQTQAKRNLHVRANRAADVFRTCFFLLFTVLTLMSLGDIATLLQVQGRDLQVIAWVFTGLAFIWALMVAMSNHPIIGGVMGLIEYALIIACWSIIVNRVRQLTP